MHLFLKPLVPQHDERVRDLAPRRQRLWLLKKRQSSPFLMRRALLPDAPAPVLAPPSFKLLRSNVLACPLELQGPPPPRTRRPFCLR